MNKFKILGVVSGLIGTAIGGYYSFTSVLQFLNTGSNPNAQVGIYSAIAATILGLSLAFIAVVANKSKN